MEWRMDPWESAQSERKSTPSYGDVPLVNKSR
ncbi:hypothetical protein ACVWXS_004173 [Lysinibacillus sp. TE18511]